MSSEERGRRTESRFTFGGCLQRLQLQSSSSWKTGLQEPNEARWKSKESDPSNAPRKLWKLFVSEETRDRGAESIESSRRSESTGHRCHEGGEEEARRRGCQHGEQAKRSRNKRQWGESTMHVEHVGRHRCSFQTQGQVADWASWPRKRGDPVPLRSNEEGTRPRGHGNLTFGGSIPRK